MTAEFTEKKEPISLDQLLNRCIEIGGLSKVDLRYEEMGEAVVDGVSYPLFRGDSKVRFAAHFKKLMEELQGRASPHPQSGVPIVQHRYNGNRPAYNGVSCEFHVVESDENGMRIFLRNYHQPES